MKKKKLLQNQIQSPLLKHFGSVLLIDIIVVGGHIANHV